MKWTTLFKDFKEKVGLSSSLPSSPSSTTGYNVSSPASDLSPSPSRDRLGVELDFKRYWEEFRSSSSEKEKEATLNLTIDAFCRLVKQHTDVTQLVSMLVETHVFSFVIGRAFVTDIEKLKIRSKTKSLSIAQVVIFFSKITKDDICPGSNLLCAVEVLVSGGYNNPIDKQSLLDSGILCCLIQILDSLMGNVKPNQEKSIECESDHDTPHSYSDFNIDDEKAHQLEIEGSVVHIMKALASHPSAAQSLIEDDSLQLLFQMVANGSLVVFALHKDGLIPLHTIQLHRHSMQILGLLLANDSGCTTKYIRKHHLIRVLLLAVRDFNPNCGDSAYTMGIVDLLLECVELSYRPDADGIRLREDIHNAHGYQFLVQFALILSTMASEDSLQPFSASGSSPGVIDFKEKDSNPENPDLSSQLLPTLSRLLDVIVSLAQAGLSESVGPIGSKTQKYSKGKAGVHSRRNASSSSERIGGQFWEKGNSKVKDLEAVQMLQDIFLKAESRELQAEVLNRLFKIFSSHSENYKLCQQLRTLPLFILNMASFPSTLQEIILKILEYAVTVVNCIPEQELLSLCCLLQQPINSDLKHTIVSFFVKLLSFDQQYKKILREVGVLDIMLDDLKKQRFLLGPGQSNEDGDGSGNEYRENSLSKHLDSGNVIISSSSSKRMMESGSGRFPLFEKQETIAISWDCVVSSLKKAETNQAFFRSANGVVTILPFLASDTHRSGVLRALSCLIIEDSRQEHAEELGSIVDVLKSEIVTTSLGHQYSIHSDAKCDILGALWRILGANSAAQRVFGEVAGFSLLLTVIHSFQCEGELLESPSHIKLFTYLVRVVTAGVRENAENRLKLHSIIHSPTFCDLLMDSGIVCVEFEKQVIHLLFELAIELVIPPFLASTSFSSVDEVDDTSSGFVLRTPSGPFNPERERVYNAGAVRVLIHCLFHFTPKVQLHVLNFIEKLASVGSFNQEALTSVGCVELLLDTIKPLISCSSPILHQTLKIVEVLGAYRLSASELRVILRYVLQMGHTISGRHLVSMVQRMILMEDYDSDNVPLAPFMEMDMRRNGHASIQVSLGERSWPPTSGYSFVCWFQFRDFLNLHSKEADSSNMHKRRGSSFVKNPSSHVFRIFSVASADTTNTVYAELYLQEDGMFILATSTSSFLSFSGLDLEEEKWHHLAVVHSKPNALAGLFHSSVASIFFDGKLKHTGKLGYSLSPFGRSLQVTIGVPSTYARMSSLSWKLRSCYLFEEVLTPGCICFMYILGREYRGIFQDSNLLRFVPDHACGGDSMAILDSLDMDMFLVPHIQKGESGGNGKHMKVDGSGIVWDTDRLGALSLQLSGKKLIFAFDGTCVEPSRVSGALAVLNLVDPLSAAASPIGGIPRFGRLHGDVFPCGQSVISEAIRPLGGMTVVLALIEAAETKDMLHMSLTLLASTLHQNPLNVRDMKQCRGYHLLALFLQRRMPLFDMQSLEIFFQIAACEAFFSEPNKVGSSTNTLVPSSSENVFEPAFDGISISRFRDEMSSSGSHVDLDDFSAQKDSFGRISELENGGFSAETSNCVVLSNPDMVEHVLLDWTLWVTAPISIQISLLGFLEHLVSMHWYRSHNLTILRQINLVQHLLVTLQRGDVEIPVLEKLVVLLGVILEDGFLTTELEYVVRFVVMTFDPQEVKPSHRIARESMGKPVIVRNMLLEMLIDLQVTIKTEELLEQWHKIVSSKLITYFLDEAVHPTSMRWVMTLLGVCLASSLTFSLKFRSSGGFQGLTRVLCSFYDAPDIYYILFCVLFSRPVYPRLPEVRMLDFHALIQSDGAYVELKFVELLDSVIAMAKSAFDMLSVKSMLVHENGGFSKTSGAVVSEIEEGSSDAAGELQGEALMHKTYAARLMGGESSAPSTATSLLRFMVDLAKICRPFSSVCKRPEFLESCVDLYFSCIRAAFAVKKAKEKSKNAEDIDFNDSINTSQKAVSTSIGSFPSVKESSSSADKSLLPDYIDGPVKEKVCNNTLSLTDTDLNTNNNQMDSQTSLTLTIPNSPNMSEKSSFGLPISSIPSPVVALASWLGSGTKSPSLTTSSMASSSMPTTEFDEPSDLKKSTSRGPSSTNAFPPINSNFLLQMDDVGYGGGPCSAAATAVLDFMSEVLSDMMTDQMKAVQVLENVLESVPLHVETDCVFAFQGLCLSRLLIFLERRLVCDDEGGERKLDKSRWSQNLDGLCWMIVNRVYMGAFPQPASVLKIVEFLLSMLQLSNKEGQVEEAGVSGKGILAIGRGSRQVDAHVHSLLKNTNRMVLYCFLPSFLLAIGEAELVSSFGLQNEHSSKTSSRNPQEEGGINVCNLLQLLIAHRRIIFCHRNFDTDVNSCLCVNLTSLLRDQRMQVRNMAVDILKYLLVHRRAGMEDILISKPGQGHHIDAFHGGFDLLLGDGGGGFSSFFDWFRSSQQTVNRVLEQCAGIMWAHYIAGAKKFPIVNIKGVEGRRKREMARKYKETLKIDLRHLEQVNERRYALEVVREALSTELRMVRQDKYGWVLHAESEWPTLVQQLVHERGVFPSIPKADQEWQLCPIEGPYRTRRKLERRLVKTDTIRNSIDHSDEVFSSFDAESDSFFHNLMETDDSKTGEEVLKDVDESRFGDLEDLKDVASARSDWNDDLVSNENEASLYSFKAVGGPKSSALSVSMSEGGGGQGRGGDTAASPFSSSMKLNEPGGSTSMDMKVENRDYGDNGEYLIRPYLEPFEKIRSKYNCERVVGLDKHDGIFLIGEISLYVIENFYIDESGCIWEKECESELSVIDQALGVNKNVSGSSDFLSPSTNSSWEPLVKTRVGGKVWAYSGGAWGKEKVCSSGTLTHLWRMWHLSSVQEILKRDYQLRPVAIEIFSMDGCNDLLVFHKKEREEIFKNLISMNLPRNNMLDPTISGSSKQDNGEGASRLFKLMAKSFSKRWESGEISNFQYLMHLNTLAGRGYNDLTQYPVFPWVLADYESEYLDLSNPLTFRSLDKPMGCQTKEGEEEFRKRYESWEDPDVPKFHYGSHYSSAGIVLFFLLRLPPFSHENQKLQGGQFDHADRLFNSVRDTWLSAAGKGNTSDVKELIPEFFYIPEFLENRFNLDLGEKQSGEKVGDVALPPWAKKSPREFIRKHREALECDFVSDNLHHWIDLIFGYKQRGKAAEEAMNVFYHYTYEGSVDIDSVTDPGMKASILAQINHFGQTPKQLFLKPHPNRRSFVRVPPRLLPSPGLSPHELRKTQSPIYHIITTPQHKILLAGPSSLLKPPSFTKYLSWGFPDLTLRLLSYDHHRLLSTHESLHGPHPITAAALSLDGLTLVTAAADSLLSVWTLLKKPPSGPGPGPVGAPRALILRADKSLSAHTATVTCLRLSQPQMLLVSGSDDRTVVFWDLRSLSFVRQLPEFPAPVSALYVNDWSGEVVTAAGVVLAAWAVNGDCLGVVSSSQLPSDSIVSVTGWGFPEWAGTEWIATGHQSGAVKVWKMEHQQREDSSGHRGEYRLVLQRVLKSHKHPVTALCMDAADGGQLLSGDSGGHLLSWTMEVSS